MPTSDVTPSGSCKSKFSNKSNVIIGGDILIIRPDENILFGG